jgi:hypothetical protein
VLYNDELHNLYSSPNIVRVIKSRRISQEAVVALMDEERDVSSFSVGRHEGKRPLGISRSRWEDNIKKNVMEITIDGETWIRLAQYSVQWRTF